MKYHWYLLSAERSGMSRKCEKVFYTGMVYYNEAIKIFDDFIEENMKMAHYLAGITTNHSLLASPLRDAASK